MKTRRLIPMTAALLIGLVCIGSVVVAQQPFPPTPLAEVNYGSSQIYWYPRTSFTAVNLRVSCPSGKIWEKQFPSGSAPYFDIFALDRGGMIDGVYTYELQVVEKSTAVRPETADERPADNREISTSAQTQSGFFSVSGGRIVTPTLEGRRRAVSDSPNDNVIADDQIVTGSLCVGYDCLTDGSESFGFDTIKMKENNLQIYFDDTSTTAGFPANDWRIIANDSASGGASHISIEDSTAARRVFTVKAGARANALFVDSTGRIGFGTSVPVLDLHIVRGDSPAIRLEQDTTSGWTAQTFDIAGNESNFFIRDVTGGSKLPFRIQPGSPTNSLTLRSDGRVGMGTWSPAYKVHVWTTGENSIIAAERQDGATTFISATPTNGYMGTKTNHSIRIQAGSVARLTLNTDHSINVTNGASLTAGGVWTDASSITLKTNVRSLNTGEAFSTLKELKPVKFNYKVEPADECVGFIAEEVPELVASKDHKGLSPMDIVAVLTKVVQEQQKAMEQQQKTIEELQKRISDLEQKQQ